MKTTAVLILLAVAGPALGAGVNPDFPNGERFAVEVVRDVELNREDPINATALTALWPAGRRATFWAGIRQDTEQTNVPRAGYATERRVSVRLAVRVYFGGGR
jgi:hypothetical protein